MNTDFIEAYIAESMSEKRMIHTLQVADLAEDLARLYGADPEKARVASLYHDMFRGKDIACLNGLVDFYSLDPARYKGKANLSHGKLACAFMAQEQGIEDQDILNAVSYHTTGRAGMSDLEKVVFLADALEPSRSYPDVDRLRELSRQDLDLACYETVLGTIEYLVRNRMDIDEDTISAREYFKDLLENKANG